MRACRTDRCEGVRALSCLIHALPPCVYTILFSWWTMQHQWLGIRQGLEQYENVTVKFHDNVVTAIPAGTCIRVSPEVRTTVYCSALV